MRGDKIIKFTTINSCVLFRPLKNKMPRERAAIERVVTLTVNMAIIKRDQPSVCVCCLLRRDDDFIVDARAGHRMHIEVSVALNFVISYLYNKLPRRRVNIFGEELEKCLTEKFAGHWYPEKPYRGSAYRCIKTGSPIDPVFEKASRESGVAIQDVLENLPQDLAVWVDPGEVSYRIGEKGAVKILYNENSGGLQFDAHDDRTADREVRTGVRFPLPRNISSDERSMLRDEPTEYFFAGLLCR